MMRSDCFYSSLARCQLFFWSTLLISRVASVDDKSQVRILQGNDDGWEAAHLRAQYEVLKATGYPTMICAPFKDRSVSGSRSGEPKSISKADKDSVIPVGAPGVGHDPSDDHIWYVNAYPVDGIRIAMGSLAEKYLGGPPSLVVTGPNVGANIHWATRISGTIGAAAYAAQEGIPAIALSVFDLQKRKYKEIDRQNLDHDSSFIYAKAGLRVIESVVTGNNATGTSFVQSISGQLDKSFVPLHTILSVNFQKAGKRCKAAEDYKFVFTNIYGIEGIRGDAQHCGTTDHPSDWEIMNRGEGCWASVSLLSSKDKGMAKSEDQELMLDRLGDLLTCP